MKFRSLEPNDERFPKTHHYKKWRVNITQDNGRNKTIYFGDNRYEDYTQHKNSQRRQNYLSRHEARENWDNPLTAGFWSAHLLWGESPSIVKNLAAIRKKFEL